MFPRTLIHRVLTTALLIPLLVSGCTTRADDEAGPTGEATAAVSTTTAPATERTLSRFVTVTGTLTAEEEAEVAAEIAGRVVATPIERGTRVAAGGALVRILRR